MLRGQIDPSVSHLHILRGGFMPGGAVYQMLSKRERERYAKQMAEVVRTLKRTDKNVAKLVVLMTKMVNAMGGSQ